MPPVRLPRQEVVEEHAAHSPYPVKAACWRVRSTTKNSSAPAPSVSSVLLGRTFLSLNVSRQHRLSAHLGSWVTAGDPPHEGHEPPRLLPRAVRVEVERLDGGVQSSDVIDVDAQVVVGREHRDPNRDERTPSDEPRAHAAAGDRAEQRLLVELRALHYASIARRRVDVSAGSISPPSPARRHNVRPPHALPRCCGARRRPRATARFGTGGWRRRGEDRLFSPP
jgi:hypothetical protein